MRDRYIVTNQNIQLMHKMADEAIRQETAWLNDQLQKIIDELKSQSPNPGKLQKLYHSLVDTWVPGVIISVIGNILTTVLGIQLP